MNPKHDRPLGFVSHSVVSKSARPDIEYQAVFAFGAIAQLADEVARCGWRAFGIGVGLGSARAVIERAANLRPRRRRLGRHEAILAGGRGAVRNALEDVYRI